MGVNASRDPRVVIQENSHRSQSQHRGRSIQDNITSNRSNDKKVIRYRGKGDVTVPTTDVNTLIESVFLITSGKAIGEGLPEKCIMVEKVTKKSHTPLLNKDNLEEAVFERLLLANPNSFVIKSEASANKTKVLPIFTLAEEHSVLKYLHHCYIRWKIVHVMSKFETASKEIQQCKEVIFLNTKVCLQQPELFPNQQPHKQFIDICVENKDHIFEKENPTHQFLEEIVKVLESDKDCLMACFGPLLAFIRDKLSKCKLSDADDIAHYLLVLSIFTWKASLAEVLMQFTAPINWDLGICYEQTLIGAILSLNPCPKVSQGPYEFFNNPLEIPSQKIHTTVAYIWQCLYSICDELMRILYAIIRTSPELRHQVLYWIGRCLEANRGKPNLWSAHDVDVFDTNFCSDGFCLNLCYIMLQLCQPFSVPNSERLLKIKPTYCRIVTLSPADMKRLSVHAKGLDKESTFVPFSNDQTLPAEESYHFISECFFLTHQALKIGYSIVYKVLKLNTSISRLQKLLKEIIDVYPKHVIELVKKQLSKEVCCYHNMKAALTEYHLTKTCLNFHVATASWLAQVATRDDIKDFQTIMLPLTTPVPKTLSYLPESIITNLTVFITSLEIFQGIDIIMSNIENLQHLVTLTLLFMGDHSRLKSSDSRGQLAEFLESVMPKLKNDGTWTKSSSGIEEVLRTHPLIEHLAECVLNVFVSIEMTGQNVGDEKKFNYRKSMHIVLQYMWSVPIHKNAIKRLAEEAMKTIDNAVPPLFLRFTNLLINDAIFLLDEALDHMKRICMQEIERDRGDWMKLTAEQFHDKETGFSYLSMMGRYRNHMANYTIYTFELLTQEIRGIFCHHVMVDRVAGMLNYFLEHLVGPKQVDYKVKNRQEYDFKPEQIVSDITHIYVYLGRDNQFCRAVLGEARSFSHDLFQRALNVLQKIGIIPQFIIMFEELASKLKLMEVEHRHEEELLADAPEEFLDPIMGTLMIDPVVLPTSNASIDRAVIARHLLSDQSDPFTKQPLSMDLVQPNKELKQRIDAWKKSKNIK